MAAAGLAALETRRLIAPKAGRVPEPLILGARPEPRPGAGRWLARGGSRNLANPTQRRVEAPLLEPATAEGTTN